MTCPGGVQAVGDSRLVQGRPCEWNLVKVFGVDAAYKDAGCGKKKQAKMLSVKACAGH